MSRLPTRWRGALLHALTGFAGLLALSGSLHAETLQLAVAANFTAPIKQLAANFETETGHTVAVTVGATGKFYAQIKSGAPFDVFLSADAETPARLEKEGDAVSGTRFSYATGRLVLWSAKADLVNARGDAVPPVLRTGNFAHIALASPKLAPYGAAAVEAMGMLGLLARLEPKFVLGESIGQTFSFVSTGNAELGFVALSQVLEDGKLKSGSAWTVPADLHSPIAQDAVLLARGKNNAAALAFMRFLKTDKARVVIRAYGYQVGP